MKTQNQTKEKPRGWANLQKQLEEIRNESFKQGIWKGIQTQKAKQKKFLKDVISKFKKMEIVSGDVIEFEIKQLATKHFGDNL